jgi:hypothetical protein
MSNFFEETLWQHLRGTRPRSPLVQRLAEDAIYGGARSSVHGATPSPEPVEVKQAPIP